MTILFVCTCRVHSLTLFNLLELNHNDNGFVFRFFFFFSSLDFAGETGLLMDAREEKSTMRS
ncbi:unnamed protein product [Arabidopsis halleri]